MKGLAADEEVKDKIQEIRVFLATLKDKRCRYQFVGNKVKIFHNGVCVIGKYDINFGNILKEIEKHIKYCQNY